MIYYCSDCGNAVEVNMKDAASGRIKLSEICPKCESLNVSLQNGTNMYNWKTICWWVFIAPVFGVIPFEAIASCFSEGSAGYDFFMLLALAGWIIVGLSPKYIRNSLNKNRYEEVDAFLRNKDYINAEKRLSDIINSNPNDANAYAKRGEIRLELKKIEPATNDFILSTLIEPSNIDFAFFRAKVFMYYMDEEAFNIAIERFSAFILNGYVKEECFNCRGKCYLEIGEYQKALADFEKAIKINPHNVEYVSNKNLALSKLSPDNTTDTQSNFNNNVTSDVKINLSNCTKEDLIMHGGFDENKAEKFITDRESGILYYDIDSFAQAYNLQPHEIVQIQDRLIFPLKHSVKKGRTIDF